MKEYLIAGNWKMNSTISEAITLTKQIVSYINEIELKKNVKALVCPPFTNLDSVNKIIEGSKLLLGAQNCHFEPKGAFTGEISIDMLKQFNCGYVIVGHSERRQYFYESNEFINKKIHSLLKNNVKPILCIGETIDERKSNTTFDVLSKQLNKSLKDISSDNISKIVIAYEPIWAIGTGVIATIEQIIETHNFIRKFLVENFGDDAKQVLIQYGGSVTAENAKDILAIENVNGALIGGASLKSEQFVKIIEFANS